MLNGDDSWSTETVSLPAPACAAITPPSVAAQPRALEVPPKSSANTAFEPDNNDTPRPPRTQREGPVIDAEPDAEGVWSAPVPPPDPNVPPYWRTSPAGLVPLGPIPTAAELRAAMLAPPKVGDT
jgi:hypothetical protein